MEHINRKIKTFTWTDVASVELGGIFLGLMLAVLIPSLADVQFWWYLLLYAFFAIRPLAKLLSNTHAENDLPDDRERK